MIGIKLQIGCLLIVLYIAFIYLNECRRYGRKAKQSFFDELLILGIASIVFDGATAYTVNHLDTIPEALASSVAITILVLGVYMNQEDPAMGKLAHYHDEMVMGFATLVEGKDGSTGNHIRRTTTYARLLAEELRRRNLYTETLTRDYVDNLLMAAPMHDIGKIAIPDAILQKPGKLTDEEFDQMKYHAEKGGEIIRETFSDLGREEYAQMAYQVARYHHEKWNGRGYPEGLKEGEIPLCARIMAVAFIAMLLFLSNRAVIDLNPYQFIDAIYWEGCTDETTTICLLLVTVTLVIGSGVCSTEYFSRTELK